tara:strand:+ start:244 stop:603 length:360 start_codon:yes stop_codon:yes gene_type:complete
VSTTEGPKNPKGSARAKYNRRKGWLAHALHEMDMAIDNLLAQEGTVYKRTEIDTLKQAITDFTKATGLSPPELAPPTEEELDGFMEMLENLKPWEPPSKEELATLYASIDRGDIDVDDN